jgi:hypothetical protein
MCDVFHLAILGREVCNLAMDFFLNWIVDIIYYTRIEKIQPLAPQNMCVLLWKAILY